MTLREGGTLPPSLGRRCPEGAEVGSRYRMKRNGRQSFHVSSSLARQGDLFSLSFSFFGAGMYNKKEFIHAFLCVP